MYMVIDQKPLTGGVLPLGNVSVYWWATASLSPIESTVAVG
jgi:hypothetical protein